MVATAVEQEHRVTPVELFFDLVFVFAFTQVATLLARDPTFAGIGRGVLVLAALWWAWAAYAGLTNTVDPDEGVVGAALLAALMAMFIAALAVPGVKARESSSVPRSSSSAQCTWRSTPSPAAIVPTCCARCSASLHGRSAARP